mgnify:CR=1 FL=1
MTLEEYRRKWGLPSHYPMVAPNYTARRSELAREIGLGRDITSAATGPDGIGDGTGIAREVAGEASGQKEGHPLKAECAVRRGSVAVL